MEDAESGGWSDSVASSRSSAIGTAADTVLLLADGSDSVVDSRELAMINGGGLSEIRRNGAAGKLARLLLTGPPACGLATAPSRSGRLAKHWATFTPLSFRIRLVSSSSWCSFSHLRFSVMSKEKVCLNWKIEDGGDNFQAIL